MHVAPSLYFQINPSSGQPIYRQLMDQVKTLVGSGRLKSGDFLPPIRRLADDLEINQMTVSKAYSLLERESVVQRLHGRGMKIVGKKTAGRASERMDELVPLLEQVAARAFQLSLSRRQVLAALDVQLKGLENDSADSRNAQRAEAVQT